MSKNAMAGAVTLCGVGLCMIGGALMMQSGSAAHATAEMPLATTAAIASATHAQAGATVVWYGVGNSAVFGGRCGNTEVSEEYTIYRAWSDGRFEMRTAVRTLIATTYTCNPMAPDLRCADAPVCLSPWITLSSPTEGFKAAADLNADELVDAVDLASILSNWGDAPRVPFPPSDCPLNLINP